MRKRVLEQLWDWAYLEGRSSIVSAVDVTNLHARYPTPEDRSELPFSVNISRKETQKARAGVISGPPFTRRFERYLDGVKPMTPIRKALRELMPRRGQPWSMELRIAWAVVEAGHSDPQTLAGMMGCRMDDFEDMAIRVLTHLQQKATRLEEKREAA